MKLLDGKIKSQTKRKENIYPSLWFLLPWHSGWRIWILPELHSLDSWPVTGKATGNLCFLHLALLGLLANTCPKQTGKKYVKSLHLYRLVRWYEGTRASGARKEGEKERETKLPSKPSYPLGSPEHRQIDFLYCLKTGNLKVKRFYIKI